MRDRRPERETAGAIVDEDGKVLGEHAGIEGFTIGQRRGLGIAVGSPRYVVQIEPLSRNGDGRPEGVARENRPYRVAVQLAIARPAGPIPCLAQIRAQHRAVPATVEPLPGERARLIFESSQSAIAPGQVVTVYQDDLVLGGGWIEGLRLDTAAAADGYAGVTVS